MRRAAVLLLPLLIATACTKQSAPTPGRDRPTAQSDAPEATPSAADATNNPTHDPPTHPVVDPPWGDGGIAWAFLDYRHGLVARNRTLWYSSDGFHTWSVRARMPGRILGMTSLGSRRVWITTGCRHDRCPTMLSRSDDRGLHWTTVGPTTVESMSFVTPEIAFTVPSNTDRVLFRSTDGGLTFRPFAHPCITGGVESLDDVEFATPTSGLALCTLMYGVGNQDKVLVKTDDGGRTWWFLAGNHQNKSSYVTKGDLSTGGYAYGVSMLPDGRGWMPEQIGGIQGTTDGGRHWDYVSSPVVDAFDAGLFPDGSGWAYGADQRGFWSIYRTPDLGATWRLVHRFDP